MNVSTWLCRPAQITCLLLVSAHAHAAKPGDVFQDCKDCPEMVVLPAGSYLMGAPTMNSAASPTKARCTP